METASAATDMEPVKAPTFSISINSPNPLPAVFKVRLRLMCLQPAYFLFRGFICNKWKELDWEQTWW